MIVARPLRRLALLVGVFLLGCLLLYRDGNGNLANGKASWPDVGSYLHTQAGGVELPVLRPEDQWKAPADWDSLLSTYDKFPRLLTEYAPSTRNSDGHHDQRKRPARPYPEYDSSEWRSKHRGNYIPCMGPRGIRLDDRNEADEVFQYTGRPAGFANPQIGSTSVVGFEHGACFERHGRWNAYGLKDARNPPSIDAEWDKVDWASLQSQCIAENKARFDLTPRPQLGPVEQKESQKSVLLPRTAIVFRSYHLQIYTEEVKRNMRAVIQELSLRTGGQFEVFMLLEIKDKSIPIFDSQAIYQQTIEELVPLEFQNMTILWNEWKWREDYPLLPESFLHVHMSQWLPMQYFQKLHPEFDYYWNWEMDVRYTGHYFELIRSLDDWTTAQPRKGQWERAQRFYIPRIHGTYQNYRDTIQARYVRDGKDTSIWGPVWPGGEPNDHQARWQAELDIKPPVSSPDQDDFSWGVGEPADLIVFLPLFDPDKTNYIYWDGYYNYPPSFKPDIMPRRTNIITFSRLSSRLLKIMELENVTPPGHYFTSESWPQSAALHHGLKAVSVPHGIYMDRDWPAQAVDWVFNNGDQERVLAMSDALDPRGEGAGGPDSTFGLEREHNWEGSTWYYKNDLTVRLYQRWMGWEIDSIGGRFWEERNGHYCLPPMLLHPVKFLEESPDNSS